MTTSTATTFYPFYSHKPSAGHGGLAQLEISQPSEELLAWRALIGRVDDSGAVTESNGQFLVSQQLLAQHFPDVMTRHAVLQAVAASNGVPTAAVLHAAALAPASGATTAADAPERPTVAEIIQDILGIGADVPNIQQNVTDIAAGTKVLKKHWWGVELAFTQQAATALGSLLSKNLGGVTTLLSALGAAIPAIAVLIAVSTAASVILNGVGAWIDSANNSGNGVLLTLYAWIFPFFLSASAPVTVP